MAGFLKSKGLGASKVKRDNKEISPQEVLLDSLAQRKRFFGQRRFEVPLRSGAFYIFFFAFLALFLVLAGKTFWLQGVRGEELSEAARSNYERIYYDSTDRGVVYDSELKQLVHNSVSFDLVVYKKDLPVEENELDELIQRVISLVDSEKDPAELKLEIKESDSSRILVKQHLSHEEVVLLRSLIEELPGFYIKENVVRDYESGPYFSHIIGYLARAQETDPSYNYSPLDYVGHVGLEKEYETVLRGEKEQVLVEKNVLSEEVSRHEISKAQPGKSLVLWLDSGLQKKSTDSLQAVIRRFGAEGGAVVALDPETGGVLSLVSLPSFDNNMFSREITSEEWEKASRSSRYPFWNRATSGAYASGSTIKPLIASAALQEGVVGSGDVIRCGGRIRVENPWFPDKPFYFNDWSVHGPISLKRAIAESCNVYFYTVGGGHGGIGGLGVERIKKYLNLFGWGIRTGIDLPGERQGLIPDPQWKKANFEERGSQIWMPGDTYNLSIGQGYLSVTPLQVASSFVPLANGGRVYKPRLVKEIVDENRNLVKKVEPEIAREGFIDSAHIQAVREGMRGAVIYGTGVRFNSLPVTSACKTGTAQTGREEVYNNWVTVFAPYEDPEIVLTVMVENVPQEQGAALTAARDILGWYFGEEGLEKEEGVSRAEEPEEGQDAEAGEGGGPQ